MSSRVPRWAKLGSRWSCLALALFSATIVTIALPLVSRATPAIQVALLPQQQTVAPGADFYVDLQVTQPSNAGFTAWEGTLVFNPAAVSYVPIVPQSAQDRKSVV